MPDYAIRLATTDDVDALVHHRLSMFSEMGTPFDAPVIRQMFRLEKERRARERDD